MLGVRVSWEKLFHLGCVWGVGQNVGFTGYSGRIGFGLGDYKGVLHKIV